MCNTCSAFRMGSNMTWKKEKKIFHTLTEYKRNKINRIAQNIYKKHSCPANCENSYDILWLFQKGFGSIVTGLKLCCCQLNIEETLIASQLCESLFEFSRDFSHFPINFTAQIKAFTLKLNNSHATTEIFLTHFVPVTL
jgi:hypothetical protein